MSWTMMNRWFNTYGGEIEWIEPTEVLGPDSEWVIIGQEPDDNQEVFDIAKNINTKELRYTLI